MKAAAPVSIVLIDPLLDGPEGRVARWDLTADEAAGAFHKTPFAIGIQMKFYWPGQPPRNRDCRVVARYTTADGRKLEAELDVTMDHELLCERWPARQAEMAAARPLVHHGALGEPLHLTVLCEHDALPVMMQVGGVLEPVTALPVIIEDDVLVGGGCGVYEGTRVRARAVLAPGVQLTAATPVFDLVREETYRATPAAPLEIPEGAVVVPGSRAVTTDFGRENGLALYAAVIVKYRDERTDAATKLEDYLR